MKLQLALATAILAVSTSAVQAADKGTPDILASVSAGSVQALSKAGASKVRGEYYTCGYFWGCGYEYSATELDTYSDGWGWSSREYRPNLNGYINGEYVHVSR